MYRHSYGENLYSLFYTIRLKLNEVSASYWTDLEIYNWLNRSQAFIAKKSKCLHKSVTVTTDGSQEYDLRDNSFADIIDIAEDGVTFYVGGTNYIPLTYKTKKQLNVEFPGWQGVAASIPQYYYYNKATKTIGLYPKCNSANQGDYLFVEGYHNPKVLHAGTAAGGDATTITLAAGSSTAPYPSVTNNYYNDIYIEINSGTGAGQKIKVTDYDGDTKKCTITFPTAPSTDSVYGMVPEIPEEAHYLMELYGFWKAWGKGGSRTTLANNYRDEFLAGLSEFTGEMIEADDEEIVVETYR